MSRARWLQITGSALLVLWLLGEQAGFWPSPILQRLEWISYDQRVNATLPHAAPEQIVVIDIDEASLQQLGQWPWPRAQVAELIRTLFEDYQIQLLGMDLVFAEQEQNLLIEQWQQLRQAYPALANSDPPVGGDALLARTLAAYPVIMGFYFERTRAADTANATASTGVLPAPLAVQQPAPPLAVLPLIKPDRYSANLEILQQAALGAGFFDNPTVDADGIFRRVPLVQSYNDQLYPSLPLAMFQLLLGQPPVQPDAHFAGGVWQLEGLDFGGYYFPTDPQAAVLVPWYGPRNTFIRVSVADVLSGRVAPAQLAGSIALLGASAPGLMDLRSTPVNAIFPGVEIQASLLAGMLQMKFKHQPGYAMGATVVGLLLLGLIMTWLYPHLPALWMLAVSGALLIAHGAGNLYAWQQGLVLPLASGILLILLLTGWHLAGNFWRESAAKRQVAAQFGLYVPPELVEDIVAHPEARDLTGQVKALTVLFSDVRGFTAFAEQVPPAQLTSVMNQLLSPVTRAIHDHRGTIDKYMGDAVMAFWGAPLPDADHAWHAIQGALAMQQALAETNQQFRQQNLPALKMGIGIHTGPMNVGNMGSDFRMAYTVLGDNVNLGSRIEGLTKIYGTPILISDDTRQALTGAQRQQLHLRPVDKVRVKGRDAPVMLYQVLIEKPDQQALNAVNSGWQAYHERDFADARSYYEELLKADPDDALALLFRDRCHYYLQEPPPADWDGVFTHEQK
ncbi:adenylate/guanylate cyclase domain-containing protein [Pseudidiomarina sp.]|uniref:adenylate/guanylate cyclase domain-containing protein n=1 Tax=Pseudidiomarina sp. TaxID=2081707 RepID=UPI00299EE8EC|nr:adenylate/guanylate cyclase domain-containing protein [Pseudidiomarina sp.]MDX1705265.1 adenylate/guanylate cyclase domain-containing protein [Pseudidiomarina sp.]